MAARTVKQIVKMTLPAGQAAPSPPVGPRLGQMGVNIMQFCKEFNAATSAYVEGTPLTTRVTAYTDRTADMQIRSPPTSYLIKRAAGVEKGAMNPGTETVGTISVKHVYAIAELKKGDKHLQHLPMEALCRSIARTAGTCGVVVEVPAKAEVEAEVVE